MSKPIEIDLTNQGLRAPAAASVGTALAPPSGVKPQGRLEQSRSSTGAVPFRIQLRRTKGWRMPANTVKVDRTTKWGNPFTREKLEAVGICGCPNCVLVTYEHALSDDGKALIREHLQGKNLACWCAPGAMCHADLLLAIANDWDMQTLQPSASADTRRMAETALAGSGRSPSGAVPATPGDAQ